MNILLVDDQREILEDIKRRVNWEKLGVNRLYLTNSASEAKKTAQEEAVDILLTDIEMPVENGIELSGWFRKNYPQIPCIFLTAHADFQYAQNAIRNGGFDYILQPARTEEIEDVIRRCIEYLRQIHEREMLAEKGSHYDEVRIKVLENLVSKLFEIELEDLQFMEEWEKEINKKIQYQWFLPLLITSQEEIYRETRESLENLFEERYPFLLVEGKSLRKYYESQIIVCGHGERPCDSKISEAAETIYEKLYQKKEQNIMIYVGKPEKQNLLGMTRLVRKTQWNNVRERTGVIPVREKKVVLKLREPDKGEWRQWLLKGDGELIRNQIKNLLEYAESENQLTFSYIAKLYNLFVDVWVICCYEKKMDGKEWFGEEYTYEEFLQAYTTVQKFNAAVNFIIEKFNQILSSELQMKEEMSTAERIDLVKVYINENLDKNITRTDAAAITYLSEDYFSKLFKTETGYGFKEYVLLKKMEYCKQLLRETNYPVGIIAGKIGYDNFSNFSQMFKKYTGKTPQEYRAER